MSDYDHTKYDEMLNTLSSYNYMLPLVVAEYFCYVYFKYIRSNFVINGKLFRKLSSYKNDIFFVFAKHENYFIKFIGVNLYISDDNWDIIAEINNVFSYVDVSYCDLIDDNEDFNDTIKSFYIQKKINNNYNKYTGVYVYRF